MKKKILLCISSAFLCSLLACNEDELLNDKTQSIKEVEVISIGSRSIKKVNDKLAFSSKEEMKEVASLLRKISIKDQQDENFLSTRAEEKNEKGNIDFKSLYDIFESAMNEAESYYERPGGYEEFKEKYSALYFPEEGDDYSAYLPISDKDLARVVNENCEVIIDNQIITLRDIHSYQQLVELGETPPNDATMFLTKSSDVTGINKISEQKVGKNKVWVKTKQGRDGFIPTILVEVCFRKKNFAGIWYNHNSNTRAYLSNGYGLKMYAGKDHESMSTCKGFSSHDYYYAVTSSDGISTDYVQQDIKIEHWGTKLTMTLTVSYPPRLIP